MKKPIVLLIALVLASWVGLAAQEDTSDDANNSAWNTAKNPGDSSTVVGRTYNKIIDTIHHTNPIPGGTTIQEDHDSAAQGGGEDASAK
ncbi:MAG: hypothetical protein ACLQMF_20160 [Rectinemataceae bacterium]